MKNFIIVLILLMLFSCAKKQHEQPQVFLLDMWVTKIDVCKRSPSTCHKQKVLFVYERGKIGVVLSESEKIALIPDYFDDKLKIHLCHTEDLGEYYGVYMRSSSKGILVFISPVLTLEVNCNNRVGTTAYFFSTTQCQL